MFILKKETNKINLIFRLPYLDQKIYPRSERKTETKQGVLQTKTGCGRQKGLVIFLTNIPKILLNVF